jgi:hypothetical protein
MARFDTAFDATGIEPTTAYEILPAGKYRAQIVESEMRVTKNGMGQYLWLMLDILEGPQQGRKVFDQLNLVNANPTTVEIAQRTLSGDLPRHGQAAGERQRGAAPDPDDDPGRREAPEGRLRRAQHDPLPRAGRSDATYADAVHRGGAVHARAPGRRTMEPEALTRTAAAG